MGDLFEVKSNPQLDKGNFVFNEESKFPYFTRTEFNNGILGYVDYLDEEHKITGGCLAVGMIAMKFFYMEKDFYAGQFTKRAVPKSFTLTPRIATYFISLLNKNQGVFQNILIRHFERVFSSTKIQLPTKNGEIDFAFMEHFIAELEAEQITELEAERMAELEAYLLASGLKDYTLTKEEKKVLAEIESGDVEWGEFQIKELFEVKSVKSFDEGKLDLYEEKQPDLIEFVGRTRSNNGVKGYIKKLEIEPNLGNIISVSQIGTVSAQFREHNWYASQNIFSLTAQGILQKPVSLFYVSVTDKSLNGNFSDGYSNYPTLVKLKNLIISVPTQNNQPDYEKMDTFISAIQKLVIKDVVQYADKKIAATQRVVNTKK